MNKNKFRWIRHIIFAISIILSILSCLLGCIYISIWIDLGKFTINSIIGIIYIMLAFSLPIVGLIYFLSRRY